jgi:carbonic anhydrase
MAADHAGTHLSADEALTRLIEGNQRFLKGQARNAAFRLESLGDLAKAQRPYATILGCSDSRVPPEWVFDAGLGELFVIRVAGNVYSPEIAGTLQYAGSYLETPLFVVLGHEGCGAISAALATRKEGTQFRSWVQLLLANILPGLPALDPTLSPEDQASRAVESNVRWTVRQIVDAPKEKSRAARQQVKIVGAIYEIGTGRVRLLPPDAAG